MVKKSHKNIPSQSPTWRSRRSKHSKPVRKVLISSAKTWHRPGFPGTGNRGGLVVCWFFMVFWHPNMPMTWGWGWGIGLPSGAGSLPVYESHVRRSSWPSWTYFIQVQFLDPLGTHLNVDELKDGLSSTC